LPEIFSHVIVLLLDHFYVDPPVIARVDMVPH
jgi:hypothetical protein